MMNDKIINSVTGQAEPPVLSESELEAKAKQFYEDWLRDVSAIKSYTEWLDYLSNKAMEERSYEDYEDDPEYEEWLLKAEGHSELAELTDPENPDSPRWGDMM